MLKIGAKIDEVRVDGSLQRLIEDLNYYKGIGLSSAELPVHGLDAIRNGKIHLRRVKEILNILNDFDFSYSVHSPNPLNLMEQEQSGLHLSVFRASLEFTLTIGSSILVYHAGRFIPEETFPFQKGNGLSNKRAAELLEMEKEVLAKLSSEYSSVTICVENARPYSYHSPYCYGERIDLLKEQIEEINRPNVKINLDVGHLYMAAQFYQFDPVEATAQIQPHIVHTHIHDNFGKSIYHHEKIQTHQIPFGRGDSHMPVGWGQIPMAQILSTYLSTYRGMLIMELRNRYFLQTGESKENLLEILKAIS